MGIPVLILGESGSGKSTSLRNFCADEVAVISVQKNRLPFKSDIKVFRSDDYTTIEAVIKKTDKKAIVIDDAQYLMGNEFMRGAKITGFQKFTDIALNFWTLIQTINNELPDDTVVYLMAHTERDVDGHEKIKTIGKLLDEKITIEGMFDVVLKTSVQDGKYEFTTQTNGKDTVKSPMGMFTELTIPNDLKEVHKTIGDYYELPTQKVKTGKGELK